MTLLVSYRRSAIWRWCYGTTRNSILFWTVGQSHCARQQLGTVMWSSCPSRNIISCMRIKMGSNISHRNAHALLDSPLFSSPRVKQKLLSTIHSWLHCLMWIQHLLLTGRVNSNVFRNNHKNNNKSCQLLSCQGDKRCPLQTWRRISSLTWCGGCRNIFNWSPGNRRFVPQFVVLLLRHPVTGSLWREELLSLALT